jgi:hypothetical protein
MTGISSVPVCAGVPQAGPVPVYVVDGRPHLTENEAVRAAEVGARLCERPADILVGSFHMDGLQHVRTVTPAEAEAAQAARWKDGEPETIGEPVAFVAPTAEAVGTAFDTTGLGADSLSASVSLPELAGPVDYIAKTDPKSNKKKGPFVAMDPPAWHSLPICGLVTIAVDKWEPKSRLDVPPSPTTQMGMELAAQFAIAFNQSNFARQRRRWCVVTNRGTCLMLTGIPIDQRPLNPCDFPPCVQQGMTYPDVELIADEQNTERFKVARIPRNWTVSLRRADSVTETHA